MGGKTVRVTNENDGATHNAQPNKEMKGMKRLRQHVISKGRSPKDQTNKHCEASAYVCMRERATAHACTPEQCIGQRSKKWNIKRAKMFGGTAFGNFGKGVACWRIDGTEIT